MRTLLFCAALLVVSATAHRVDECGVPRIQPHLEAEDRIEGGKEAVPGSWPWHVQVNTRLGHHRCSGALIDEQHVVTTASCIWKLKNIGVLKVLAGAHSRDAVLEGERSADVEEACVFKGYQGGHMNNIAVLKLKTPLNRTDTIQPICLPSAPVVGGWNVYATGYGHTHHDHDSPVKGLSQARVKTVANNVCYDENDTEVPKSVFCTVYDHGSPCMTPAAKIGYTHHICCCRGETLRSSGAINRHPRKIFSMTYYTPDLPREHLFQRPRSSSYLLPLGPSPTSGVALGSTCSLSSASAIAVAVQIVLIVHELCMNV